MVIVDGYPVNQWFYSFYWVTLTCSLRDRSKFAHQNQCKGNFGGASLEALLILHASYYWLVVSTPRRKKPIIIGIITPKFVEQMTCLKPPNTWQHYLGTLLIIRKVDQLGWSMRCLAGDQDLVIPADIRNCRVGLSASGPRQSQDIKIHWIYLACTKYLATTLDAMDNHSCLLKRVHSANLQTVPRNAAMHIADWFLSADGTIHSLRT